MPDYHYFMRKYGVRNMDSKVETFQVDQYTSNFRQSYAGDMTVTIDISKEGFDKLVMTDAIGSSIIDDEIRDNMIRENVPAVKAAYDQYQMLLSLSR